ncbi:MULTISPECIES: hypothetical protein [Stenotrophomonas maltophilia group]|uniref:hypothetical protein n=1 Tax=Stenotrophomonas maltophilia group TaxID=995085 RepID=UPI001E3BB981|nr:MULTISPECIES: hypothetical protein [Stenotrophomonas maltophilia group]MDQ4678848.1 hypothetical protein [Stenotrophomonas maltophilia group sp. RNC7]UGB21841.1 hypothetical protein LQ335_00830 [Stenotrophomonas maltophilia]
MHTPIQGRDHPTQMVAIEITQAGGPEVPSPATRPIPSPKADEVLIRVLLPRGAMPICPSSSQNRIREALGPVVLTNSTIFTFDLKVVVKNTLI